MSDREPFEAARTAGLRVRHETREARAIRKQVAEEISTALGEVEEYAKDLTYELGEVLIPRDVAVDVARRIGVEETPS